MKKEPMITAISLGWGLQSWTLAAMTALGDLPPVDYAIHSDTSWERTQTYAFAEAQTAWLETHGVQVVTVRNKKLAGQTADQWGGAFIPAYTLSQKGNRGQLRRQCTHKWKIQPMRWFLSEQLAARGVPKQEGTIEVWLGITTDEWRRAKDADVKYITHRFPLLEKKMSRLDCLRWLEAHKLPVPVKSSCTFCPYHNKHAWQELKRRGGADWAQAREVDEQVRHQRPPDPLFVHPARKPLDEAIRLPEEQEAMQGTWFDLFDSDDADAECDSGFCFL